MFALPGFLGRPVLSCRIKSVRWTLLGRKKPRPFDRGFVFALPGFLGRPGIVLPYKMCPVDTFRQKKPPTFVGDSCVRVTYLPG